MKISDYKTPQDLHFDIDNDIRNILVTEKILIKVASLTLNFSEFNTKTQNILSVQMNKL